MVQTQHYWSQFCNAIMSANTGNLLNSHDQTFRLGLLSYEP
jgi:hypothetical protein